MVVKFIKKLFVKTRTFLGDKIKKILSKSIDENTLEELEHALYSADLGSKMSHQLVEDIQDRFRKNPKVSPEEILDYIKKTLKQDLKEKDPAIHLTHSPSVILIVGVNGNGKTTTIAKLAAHYKKQGKKVLIAAADTFRAAAVDQLQLWADHVDVEIVKAQIGSDPASVAFDGLSAALARKADVLLIDTAGRLQTKTDLMQELEKIKRVLKKLQDTAPHETLLVVDATVGQNAIEQARIFNAHTPLTGLVLTKMDGTAKGGIVVPIQQELNIPIKFIGVGESIEDLKPFDADIFVDELFY